MVIRFVASTTLFERSCTNEMISNVHVESNDEPGIKTNYEQNFLYKIKDAF